MHPTLLWLAIALAVATGAAQSRVALAEGYDSEVRLDESEDPLSFHGFAVGPAGRIYAAIDNRIWEIDAAGRRTLVHRFPAANVGLLRVFGTDLYAIESGSQQLFRYDLTTRAHSFGAVPAFTFDLVRAPTGELLVSANPEWLSGGENAVWLVDSGGNHREIIQLRGPSGPLAFDDLGNLFYATQTFTFPTPPGTLGILRFDAAGVQAALRGGPALTMADGVPVLTGLDGAFALAIDDRRRIYWSNPVAGGVERSLPGMAGRDPRPLIARPQPPDTTVALQLQFVEAGRVATFDPYQPAAGGSLYVTLTDWGTRGEVLHIRPRRPDLTSSPALVAAPGPVDFRMTGLPPAGPAWLCLTALHPITPERAVFSWNGTPFWSALDFGLPPLCVPVLPDGTGQGTLRVRHPGGFSGTLHFQAIGFDPSSWPFGTTTTLSLSLLP